MTTRIIHADVMDGLRQLPDESVHCVATSPPYWRMRDYGFEGQIGLEPTVAEHVAKMVEVFREVRRVLRKDGVMMFNYGDMWAGSGEAAGRQGSSGLMAGRNISYARTVASSGRRGAGAGSLADEPTLKPKDLVMMPHRIAIAMQDDGWWVRDDIVWLKPNPMPSSVKDRCTPAKEYVFQMTRSGRYFWDAVAIAETAIYAGPNAPDKIKSPMGQGFTRAALRKNDTAIESGNARRARATDGFQDRWDEQAKAGGAPLTRNRRNVWSIATEPYPGGHFATMPTELARLCILAATSAKGCCATCGAPWRRKVERTFHPQPDVSIERGVRGAAGQKPMVDTSDWDGFPRGSIQTETLGWLPTCEHDAPVVPCTVLDPFGGAGTTALVAARLGRNAILIEANPAYVTDHIEPRLADEATPLLDIMEGDAT